MIDTSDLGRALNRKDTALNLTLSFIALELDNQAVTYEKLKNLSEPTQKLICEGFSFVDELSKVLSPRQQQHFKLKIACCAKPEEINKIISSLRLAQYFEQALSIPVLEQKFAETLSKIPIENLANLIYDDVKKDNQELRKAFFGPLANVENSEFKFLSEAFETRKTNFKNRLTGLPESVKLKLDAEINGCKNYTDSDGIEISQLSITSQALIEIYQALEDLNNYSFGTGSSLFDAEIGDYKLKIEALVSQTTDFNEPPDGLKNILIEINKLKSSVNSPDMQVLIKYFDRMLLRVGFLFHIPPKDKVSAILTKLKNVPIDERERILTDNSPAALAVQQEVLKPRFKYSLSSSKLDIKKLDEFKEKIKAFKEQERSFDLYDERVKNIKPKF